jgi:energy-coupling factor transporter transmembrane protein EcfT
MADNCENNVSPEKAAKKKSLLERIFNWVCLTLFLLFIIALIFLRTPWTLVAVFIAILLVNTVVPKSIRKYIFLAFVIIVAAFVVWIFLPDDTEGWRPYTFDKELAAMEAKRSVPTEDNAAAIYNQLLESYDPNSFSKDFLSYKNKDLILSEFWESKDYPEAASWLEENQQVIDQLILACKKNKCRFPIAGDISSPDLKPPANFKEVRKFWWFLWNKRLIPMRRWGELLIISANNDIAEGRIDEGLEKYIAALQIAKHLYQQPTPMDLLMGIAIHLRGLEQINEYIVKGHANDEYLQLLNNVVKSYEYDWRSDLHKVLDREKLMFKSIASGAYLHSTMLQFTPFNGIC